MKRAHYEEPATGPEGKMCDSCAHMLIVNASSTRYFCGKVVELLGNDLGPSGEIDPKDPACSGFRKFGFLIGFKIMGLLETSEFLGPDCGGWCDYDEE